MAFNPDIAAIRFGEGLSPDVAAPVSVAALLAQLDGPDRTAERLAITKFSDRIPEMGEVNALRRKYRRGRNGDDAEALRDAYRKARVSFNRKMEQDVRSYLARSIRSEAPFRERLTRFWGDHFTAIGKVPLLRAAGVHYLEDAIRPHIAGRFADMLKAVVRHPMMLVYLDQVRSVGPNAVASRGGRRGLNENLARELIELHTLGAGAAYGQADVTQLAELLTGLTANFDRGFYFDADMAEPGAEQVLGVRYGDTGDGLADIDAALEDLAVHPDTARHLARKLAVHFCADAPDAGLVEAMSSAYLAEGGALMPVYEAMLEHPAAWDSFGQKVKQPIDFVTSALRALALPEASLLRLNRTQLRGFLLGPMAAMGQPWMRPAGPDGWPEAAEAWVTPQGLAARVQWAMAAPQAFFRGLPDPRDFLQTALGDLADPRVRFAAESAESRREGIGLVLASPEFQRR